MGRQTMSKKMRKQTRYTKKKASDKEEELEYRNWMDVIKEIPIVIIILFLLLPVIWIAGQMFAWIYVVFRDYFEVVAVIIIVFMIFALYIYAKYFR